MTHQPSAEGSALWQRALSHHACVSRCVPHASGSCFRSNTWTNAPRQPRQQQGWGGGGGGEGWGNGGGGDSSSSSSYRGGSNNHWGDAQKGGGGGGGGGAWEGDSDRSGSGCWSDPSRANANNGGGGGGNTWTGSSAANTQDQGNHNQGSNSWGDPTGPKPAPQGRGQGWGEPQKHHHGNQSWGEPPPKTSNPSNEWGKGPEPVARGGQGPTKPTGDASFILLMSALVQTRALTLAQKSCSKFFVY